MRSYFVPATAIAMVLSVVLSARSDEVPNLDMRPICRGIASQSADPLAAGLQTTFEQCLESEKQVREQLKKEWSTFSTADKRHCVALAKTGGESSNTELLTCLEMSRDVRALRSTEAASSKAATTQVRSSPSPSEPSAPANTASRPASEPTMDVDSMLKELQRVKADAQNARASEATVRGKLAATEADLPRAKQEAGRAKEEVGRATKEAQQAKDDAQAARKLRAEAENKLADAETARTAAEGREQACEIAAKSQSGFGARLRGWFGHKPSNQ